jgi:hypothetical protein
MAALFGSVGTAQPWFAEARKHHLPPAAGSSSDVKLADLDGDGDLDAVVCNGATLRPKLLLWLNQGGIFTDVSPTHVPAAHRAPWQAAFADLDRDGDLDLVTAGGSPALYLNDGQGRLSYSNANPLTSSTPAVATADFDGNGLPDLLTARPSLFLNQPGLAFVDATGNLGAGLQGGNSVIAADFDRDGDQDIVLLQGASAPMVLLRNDGQARFTAVNLAGIGGTATGLSPGDVDGDGDLDVVATEGTRVWIYTNDGVTLVPTTSTLIQSQFAITAVAVLDIEGDGDGDIVVTARTSGGENRETDLWVNQRPNILVPFVRAARTQWPLLEGMFTAIAAGDIDGDRDLDLVLATGATCTCPYEVPDVLLLNDGAGAFTIATTTPLDGVAGGSSAVAAADLDGDGRLDLVHEPLRLARQADGPRFVAMAAGPAANWQRPLAVDVDRDGDLDLLGQSSSLRLALNQGATGFVDVTSTHLPPAAFFPVAAGDADGDGDPDIVISDLFGAALLDNQGNGTFALGTSFAVADVFTAALSDLDRDGDNDIVLTTTWASMAGSRVFLFFQQAPGTYVSRIVRPRGFTARVVLCTDIDADGDPDLVIGGGQVSFPAEANSLLVNDGAGNFAHTTRSWPARATNSSAAAAGDVDADGDVDLLFTDATGLPMAPNPGIVLYRNDGANGFVEAAAALPNIFEDVRGIALADFDRDGDPDLVLTGAYRTSMFANFARHLAAPFLWQLGGRLTLEVHGDAGSAALLVLSPLGANIPWPPLGWLGVDPSWLYLLPSQLISPSRTTLFTLPLPQHPWLHGLPLFTQALVVPPLPGAARLTGTVRELLQRL